MTKPDDPPADPGAASDADPAHPPDEAGPTLEPGDHPDGTAPRVEIAPPPPPPRPGPPRVTPLWRDPLGLGLVAVGTAASVAGVALWLDARAGQCGDPLCADRSYDAYVAAEARARDRRTLAIVAAGAGGALLVGGALRLALRDRRAPVEIRVAPSAGGGAVTIAGGF